MASDRKTRARLRAAVTEEHMIRVERSPKFADRLNGFVLKVGNEWALMAQTSDGGFFDGYVAFRIADVKRVDRDRTFETTFAKAQPDWPPVYPHDVGLDSTRDVVQSLSVGGGLIGIQKDRERDAMWIGRLDEITKRFVYLHEVRPDATWHAAPLGYKLKAITTVDVATHYLVALATIAGAVPAAGE
jgi:hypothetical protein